MTQPALQLPTAGTLGGLTMVQDINAALAGLSSFLQGPAAPTAAGLGLSNLVGVGWHDITTGTLKIRDQADTAWIVIGTFDENNKVFVPAGIDTDGTLAANSDAKIPSQKAVKAFALPVSYLDTDGTLAANSDAKIPSQKAVKNFVTAQLTGFTSTDLVARDQIALTNLRLLLSTSVSTGALIQGKQWELTTDEWGASSTSQTYASGTPAYYKNYADTTTVPTGSNWNIYGSTFTAGTGTLTSAASGGGEIAFTPSAVLTGDFSFSMSVGNSAIAGGSPAIEMGVSTSVPNSRSAYGDAGNSTIGSWWLAFIGAGTGRTIAFYNNGTQVGSVTGNINVGDTFIFNRVGSALTVQQNGVTIYTFSGFSSSAALYAGFAYNYISAGFQWSSISWTVNKTTGNMTLLPPASVSLSAAPTYADAYFLWKDDSGSAVLGTDLTVELSRDGGTTWTVATITNPLGASGFDGTYTVLRARANVSGQPNGTSLTCRIKTLNNKVQRVGAPALYAE